MLKEDIKEQPYFQILEMALFGLTKYFRGNAQSKGNLKIHPISPRSNNLMNSDPD